MRYVIWLLLLASCEAEAGEGMIKSRWNNFRLFELEMFDVKYAQFKPYTRDIYAAQYTGTWKDRGAILWRINMAEAIYWDNNMHLETIDAKTVKTVGWQWELGIRLTPNVMLFHDHHSKHILDETGTEMYEGRSQFPVEDSFGIRIKLIEEKVGRGIFK